MAEPPRLYQGFQSGMIDGALRYPQVCGAGFQLQQHSAAFVISLPGLCLLRATGERLPSTPLSKPNVFPLIPHFQAYPVIPLLLLLQLDLPLILFFLKAGCRYSYRVVVAAAAEWPDPLYLCAPACRYQTNVWLLTLATWEWSIEFTSLPCDGL